MRAMLLAFAAMLIIAFGADYALDRVGFSSQERNAASSVRLD